MLELIALGQVLLIDLVLAGDNALVIAATVARLPIEARRSALLFGIGFAILARLFFSLSAAWLLGLPFLGIIGGALLLWIAYRLYRESTGGGDAGVQPTGAWAAVSAIVTADLSMSLDNILGVGAAAQGHPFALIVGLVASMCLMGTAANWIADQMSRRPWLIFVGIAAIAITGVRMIVLAI